MKIAFGTDEQKALTDGVRADLASRGHSVSVVADGQWVEVGHAVLVRKSTAGTITITGGQVVTP